MNLGAPSGTPLTYTAITKISLGIGKCTSTLEFCTAHRFLLFPLALRSHRFKKTGKRAEIFLATKFGFAHGEPNRVVKADPEYVHEAFNKSLSRLGVDYIDLYYLHRADSTVPIEHTVAAMAELVK